MPRAYKYGIDPKVAQKKQLSQHFGCARWIYNLVLDSTKKYYREHKEQLSRKELRQLLVALKHTGSHNWLNQVNSQSLLSRLLHLLYIAFKAFLEKSPFL